MAEQLLLVFSNPVDGRDDEFNAWYDNTHVSDVLDVPGVVAAQRFAVTPMTRPEVEGSPAPAQPAHRYLAVYELDRCADEVMPEFLGRIESGVMALSESLDLSSVGLSTWEPVGTRRVSQPAPTGASR